MTERGRHVLTWALFWLAVGCSDPLAVPTDRVRVHVVNLSSGALISVTDGSCEAELGPNRLDGPLEPADSLVFFTDPGCRRLRVETPTGGNWMQQWEAEPGSFTRFRVVD